VICAVLQAAMALVPLMGGRDIGIIHPVMTTTQRILIPIFMQFIIAVTMVMARMSRRTALVAVGELEQAVRLAAHRQALLLEARDELERALRTKRGRFSEQTIGHYHLGDVIGRGAMGEVYGAVDARNGDQVAVKLLSQLSLGNANHVLRFFRELRTAASVESPHVVRVLEIGEKPVPFLVMERLEGHTLSEILRERRTLTPEEVVELVSQVGIGITAAAAAGVVHRDLKPQNIFRHHGSWKILDFGVARAMEHGDTLTAGALVGTPSYMSPEQASGGSVDHRTDLYALAAVAYRALTGHPPFASADLAETIYRVVHTRPARPSLLSPELGHDVDLVLAIGMAPRSADRFASAAEFADAMRDALAGHLAPILRARGALIVEATAWSGVIKPAR
jgi:serine/threonine-protein kinase